MGKWSSHMSRALLTRCKQRPTLGAMGHHEPRTAADETADVLAALAEARRALRDLSSHLDDLQADPVAHQVRRNAKIVAAKLDEAEQHVREGNRIQLTSVS